MTIYVTQQPQSTHQYNMPYAVAVPNDQSIIKGAIWALLALNIGSTALTCGGYTLATSPLLVTPVAGIPIAWAVGTYVLASLTGSCIENASYHLGSRQVVYLQTR